MTPPNLWTHYRGFQGLSGEVKISTSDPPNPSERPKMWGKGGNLAVFRGLPDWLHSLRIF